MHQQPKGRIVVITEDSMYQHYLHHLSLSVERPDTILNEVPIYDEVGSVVGLSFRAIIGAKGSHSGFDIFPREP